MGKNANRFGWLIDMSEWLFIKHDPYAVTGRATNAKAHFYLYGKLQTDDESLVLSGLTGTAALPIKGIRH